MVHRRMMAILGERRKDLRLGGDLLVLSLCLVRDKGALTSDIISKFYGDFDGKES